MVIICTKLPGSIDWIKYSHFSSWTSMIYIFIKRFIDHNKPLLLLAMVSIVSIIFYRTVRSDYQNYLFPIIRFIHSLYIFVRDELLSSNLIFYQMSLKCKILFTYVKCYANADAKFLKIKEFIYCFERPKFQFSRAKLYFVYFVFVSLFICVERKH